MHNKSNTKVNPGHNLLIESFLSASVYNQSQPRSQREMSLSVKADVPSGRSSFESVSAGTKHRLDQPYPKPGEPRNFLSLPAEIRNLIYEYALAEEEGLHYYVPLFPGLRHRLVKYKSEPAQRLEGIPNPANELKAVCKQILSEVEDLELALNILRFDDSIHAFFFIAAYPRLRDNMHRLKILEVCEPGSLTSRAAPFKMNNWAIQLFAFCKENAQITLHHRYQLISVHTFQLARAIARLEQSGRGELKVALLLGKDEDHAERIQRFADGIETVEWQYRARDMTGLPENFRMFPKERKFPEQRFRDLVGSRIGQLKNIYPVDIETWIPILMEIWRLGW